MAKLHLLRDYSQKSDPDLGDFGLHIGTSMTGNSHFTSPPYSGNALTAQANTFIVAIGAAVDGTKEKTAAKNAARGTLNSMLDTTTDYVELNGQNNEAILLSSGFDLASTSRAPAAVTGTGIVRIANVATTKLGLELLVDKNAWVYEVQVSTTPGGWVHHANFTNPHGAVLLGLTPGTTYAIRARVMGSSNQVSEWCAPVSAMCT